jgi:hypothetical protein
MWPLYLFLGVIAAFGLLCLFVAYAGKAED